MKNKQNLLPVGFYDLIFDEAERNHKKINLTIDYFLQNGYRLIKTPLLEFAKNFSDKQIQDSFLLNDIISGQYLVLRNDITLQIARLLDTRLADFELPLKLCYVGDILLTKSNELYADRQSTQVGLEIIGSNNDSHFEIIATILRILPKISDKKLTIEFSLPNFLELFCDELKILQSVDFVDAVKKKNISLIEKLEPKNSRLISEIVLKNNNLQYLLQIILEKTSSVKILEILDRAGRINDFVMRNFPQINLSFDLFGDDKNSYHQEIAFDVFCEDFSYPIARGGKYKINEIEAFGATIYMNYLRQR